MQTSKLSSQGQVTVPKAIRDRLALRPGDLVGYEVVDGKVVLTRVDPFDAAYHAALSTTLEEWDSPEDDEAFKDL